ncbi:MAG: ribokinase [Planctomycetota bacterium]
MPHSSTASKHPGRVIVVGASNTDLVVHCPKLPQPGESVLGGDLLTFAGGKGANQAVAAARAGAKAYFIGAFGDDAFGRARRADLEKEGVDCSGCAVKKGVPSGVALIAIGESKAKAKAENLIFVAPGASMRLTPADVRRAMPKDFCEDDAFVCSLEVPLQTVLEALRLTWSGGCGSVILNPAPLLPGGLPGEFKDYCHFLTPNEVEFEALFGAPVGSRAAMAKVKTFRSSLQPCYPAILVTRGARGVDMYDAGEYLECFVAAPKVKAVDTVGAGDCFNGCLAAHFSFDSHGVNPAVEFAVFAAALKVTRHGAQIGLPHRAEILKMLRDRKCTAGVPPALVKRSLNAVRKAGETPAVRT